MAKKTLYFSTDKLYEIKNKKKRKRKTNKKEEQKRTIIKHVITTIVLILVSILLFTVSTEIGPQENNVKYDEVGNVDYKVYLKENTYYQTSYLNSGMQYVANLINTINVKFNYGIHSAEDLNFNNEYKIISELQITERNDPSKVLLTKKDVLLPTKKLSIKDNNLVIDEEVDIEYEKYNRIVEEFKRNEGLIVSSNLIITLETNTNAKSESDKLDKNNKLQVFIPLAESTLSIDTNTGKINDSSSINSTKDEFNINNVFLFIVAILTTIGALSIIGYYVYLYIKKLEKDPYQTKINSILKNYDRLIISGNVNFDESKYSNIICVETFKEIVDAAENYGVAIMHYEVIKGEKSIFIVAKDDTLVKYRVTKAYLKNKKNKEEIISSK